MKKLYFLLALAAGFAIGCEKQPEPSTPTTPENPPAETTMDVSLTIPSEGAISVYNWVEGDKVLINGTVFTLKEGAGSKTGVFTGDKLEDRFYTIALPTRITSADVYASFNFAFQMQDGNAATAHLPLTVFMEDVPTLEGVVLSESWATEHQASFRSCGVLALDLTLPADAGTIDEIIIESAGVKFPLDNSGETRDDKLALSLSNVNGGAAVKAFLAVSEKELDLSSVKLTVVGENTYSVLLEQEISMGGGLLSQISVADASLWSLYSVVRGQGTEESPYILANALDVEQMKDLVQHGTTVWFEMSADIDMADVLNWEPLNVLDPFDYAVHFDGKGHTISNFSCADKKYTSFFGVLNGTCVNVTFDKPSVSTTENASSTGVVGGYAGASNGVSATVKNVTVKNASVSSAVTTGSTFPTGGIFGTIVNTAVEGCVFEGTVQNDSYGVETNPDRCPTGGIAGKANAACSFKDCTVSGTITSARCRYTGGIVGWVSPAEDTDITGCTNNAAITGGADRAAGIVGHYQQGTISGCVNNGAVECGLVGSVSGAGGIAGYTGAAKFVKCTNLGNVTGSKNAVGGIVGYTEGVASIESCYSNAVISSSTGRYTGGIVGGMKLANSTVANCYSAGKIENAGDQEAGGIVGSMMTGQKVSCCYSTAEIYAPRVVGGIVGRACNNTWKYNNACDNTVENCIAWNPVVKATAQGGVDATGGSGAIVGFTSFKNTLTAGWRNPAMEFTASDTTVNTLCDQPDCSPENPFVMGTTPGTALNYCCPYHGKAAESTATVSSIATSLGWSTDVWDLIGTYPVLK